MEDDSPLARQILMLDTVASRYGKLPSEVLSQGDTFDVYVVNTALELQHRMQQKAEAKANGRPPQAPQLSQEQMLAMVASTRSKDGNKVTEGHS